MEVVEAAAAAGRSAAGVRGATTLNAGGCLSKALSLLGCGGLHGGHTSLSFASQVRRDAEHALDQHELAAMVHLMFLHAHQHVETCAAGLRGARRHGDALPQEVV